MQTKHLECPLDVKSVEDSGRIIGHASVFGVVDAYGDVVEKGAFQASIAKRAKIPMLWQHRGGEPIGVWEKMVEDDHGLLVEGQLVMDVARAKEAHALLRAGAISGLSIGYRIPKGGDAYDPETKTNRLKEIDLHEASVVTFPACDPARVVAVKTDWTAREIEHALRDAGMPIAAAKAVVADGAKALDQRDADEAEHEAAEAKHLATLIERLRALRGE